MDQKNMPRAKKPQRLDMDRKSAAERLDIKRKLTAEMHRRMAAERLEMETKLAMERLEGREMLAALEETFFAALQVTNKMFQHVCLESETQSKEITLLHKHLPEDQHTQIVERYWRAHWAVRQPIIIMNMHSIAQENAEILLRIHVSLAGSERPDRGPPRAPRSTTMPWTWAPCEQWQRGQHQQSKGVSRNVQQRCPAINVTVV